MTPVREFHEKFGLDIRETPGVPSPEVVKLRLRLIAEEYHEVRVEIVKLLGQLRAGAPTAEVHATLEALLKEMADLRYVVDGTAVSLGLPIDEAFEEVHRSNMTKVWPDGRARYDTGGKVLKPDTYQKADMARLMPVIDAVADDGEPDWWADELRAYGGGPADDD